MSGKRVIGLILIVLSLILGVAGRFTGAVIGTSSLVSLIPILMFIAGLVLVLTNRKLETIAKEAEYHKRKWLPEQEYYPKRTKEIIQYAGDVYISQWEAEGIFRELKRQGYEIEHDESKPVQGKYKPVLHLAGLGPKNRHVHIQKEDGADKHLLITQDPYDPRLKFIGVKSASEDRIKRMKSKIYNPNHPRFHSRTEYTDDTVIE